MARILVVEDDPDQREIRGLILQQAGYSVETAANFEEAVERRHGCQVVVLDMIPGSAELISDLPEGVGVIVLSGREPDPRVLRADRVLRKPCSSRALLTAIAQLLPQ